MTNALPKEHTSDPYILRKARHMAGLRTSAGSYRYTEREVSEYLGVDLKQVCRIRLGLPSGKKRGRVPKAVTA